MMNVNISNNQTAANVQQFLNLNKLQNNAMNGCSVVNNNNNATQPTARFTVALNNNVNNISSVFLRNSQMSPMKQQQQSQQQQQASQQSRSSSIGLAQQASSAGNNQTTNGASTTTTSGSGLNLNGINLNGNNLEGYRNTITSTLTSLNNYSINLQNQLNYAKQQQAAVAAAAAMGPSLLTAASVLNSANSLAAQMNMYQPMQTTTCNLNNTLFVGNLHASLQEIDLIQVFRPFGRIVECCKKWLHFGFVKFTSEEEACHAYVTLNGFRLKGRPMRLEFQNRTKKARIKAILAQAALQATNGSGQVNDLLGFNGVSGLNFPGMMDERAHQQQQQHHHQLHQHQQQQQSYFAQMSGVNAATATTAKSSFLTAGKLETASSSVVNSFFNADQLIKFAASGVEAKVGAASASSTGIDSFDLNQIDFATGNCGLGLGLGAIRESTNYFDLNDNDLPPSLSSSSSSSASSSSSLTSIKQYTTTTINHNTHSSSFDFKLTDDLIKDFASLNTDPTQSVASAHKHQLLTTQSQQQTQLTSTSSSSSSSSAATAPKSAAPSKPSQQHKQQQQPNDELIISLIKKTISPSMTPQHDLSSSSDSGCRSNSFILNDEDSAIGSLQSTTTGSVKSSSSSSSSLSKKETPSSLCVDELTISEHLEFTCSNSSPVGGVGVGDEEVDLIEEDEEEEEDEETEHNKSDVVVKVKLPGQVEDEEEVEEEEEDSHSDTDSDCDTSDDASEIPTDAECLNELDLIDENFLNGADEDAEYVDIIRYNNVVEKDGTIIRKKLNMGIYKSMNQTLSLFIEPHDVLKQMDLDEFNEYTLFPTSNQLSANTGMTIDSLFHFYLV